MASNSQAKPYHYSSYQQMYQSQAQMRGATTSLCKCSKFLPQLFNANKCQQCFNVKELHSIEALAEFSKVIYSMRISSRYALSCVASF